MAEQVEPSLSLDLGRNGGQLAFRDVQEVEAWIKQEQQYWSWVQAERGADGNLGSVWIHLCEQFQQMLNALAPARNKQAASVDHLVRTINDIYQSGRCVASTSERAKYLEALRPRDARTAAYALGYFLIGPSMPATDKSIRGACEAVLFERGLSDLNLEAQRGAFGQFLASSQKDGVAIRAELDKLRVQHNELLTRMQTGVAEQQAEFKGLVTRSDEELKTIARTYDERMARQAPVTYWTDTAKKHGRGKIRYGLSALASGILGVGVILDLIWQWFPADLPAAPEQAWGNWHLIRLTATLLILFTTTVWVTRILVRIFLSHVHLETDAGERAIMAQTYLALLREEKAFTEAERTVILMQLFRKAATGVVKDDAAPPHPFELLARRADKEQSARLPGRP